MSHLWDTVHPPFLDENSGSSTSFQSSVRGQKFLGHFKWQTWNQANNSKRLVPGNSHTSELGLELLLLPLLSPTGCELEKARPSFAPHAPLLPHPLPSSCIEYLSFRGCQSRERKKPKSREGKVLFHSFLPELASAPGALQSIVLTLGVLKTPSCLPRCGHVPSPRGCSPVNLRFSRATQTLFTVS